ncbi:MAG: vWA domain-containing protein [Trueperaceae bacterium]|nr:vWA domain-containing protein [Trueperaceae bacterium]
MIRDEEWSCSRRSLRRPNTVLLVRRVCCLVLLLGILVGSAYARTVVLVYDDSGSMLPGGNAQNENRHRFANYSVQNLLALLSPQDRLEVVRMSAVGRNEAQPVVLLPDLSKRDAIRAVADWQAGGSTPYRAVQTAIERLEQVAAAPDEDVWLVVFSDGQFLEDDGETPTDLGRIVTDVTALRERYAGRKFGVVFLGIGSSPERYAEPWQQAGAITYTAANETAISEALFQIAALITGRDPEAGSSRGLPASRRADGRVVVESDFPLRRLVLFRQGQQPTTVSVARAELESDGAVTPLVANGPFDTAREGLFGSVTLLEAATGQTLNAGRYLVDFGTDVDLNQVRFLPEVALDLFVRRDPTDTLLCEGAPISLRAQLLSSAGQPIDLSTLPDLRIEATLDQNTAQRQQALQPVSADTYGAEVIPPPGETTIAVSARYPGYFNLRSELFRVRTERCFALGLEPQPAPPLCANDPVVVTLQITEQNRPVDPATLADVRRSATLTTPTGPDLVTFAPTATGYRATVTPQQGENRLDATVRFRPAGLAEETLSQTLSLPAQLCTTEAGISADTGGGTDFEVPARFGPDPVPFAETTLRITTREPTDQDEVPLTVTVEAPPGVSVALGGQTLPAQGDIVLPIDRALTLTLSSDSAFQQPDAEVVVRLTSRDPELVLDDTLRYGLRLEPRQLALSVTPADPVTLTPTFSDDFVVFGERQVRVTSDEPLPALSYTLRVRDIPEGLQLRLGDALLDAERREVTLPLGEAPLRLSRNSDLDLRDAEEVGALTFEVVEEDARLLWTTAAVTLPLQPEPREIGLEPLTPDWRYALDSLADAPPYALQATVDGEAVPANEFARWRVRTDSPARIRVRATRNEESGQIELVVKPWWPLGFTVVGDVVTEVRVSTPLGESFSAPVTLRIDDIPFWQKFGGIVIALLLITALLAWIIGHLTKSTFAKQAHFAYYQVRQRGPLPTVTPRPDNTIYLRQQTDRVRWLLPFLAQEATVDGLRLRAARHGRVWLLNRGDASDLVVDGEPVGERAQVMLNTNNTIVRQQGRSKEEQYQYRTG